MFKCIKASELIKIAVTLLCIALTVTFIFGNSFDNKDESNKKSDKVVEVVKPPADEISKQITGKEIKQEDLNKYIRKAAHFTEFAVLGIELMILMLLIEKRITKLIFMPMFFGLATACTDEFIQSFNERSDMVSDIFIDFAGCAFGILVSALIFLIIKKRKAKI